MTKSQYYSLVKMCESKNTADHELAYELITQFNPHDIVKRLLLVIMYDNGTICYENERYRYMEQTRFIWENNIRGFKEIEKYLEDDKPATLQTVSNDYKF